MRNAALFAHADRLGMHVGDTVERIEGRPAADFTSFMQRLGDSLERRVFVSSEGGHDLLVFGYGSETRTFHFQEHT